MRKRYLNNAWDQKVKNMKLKSYKNIILNYILDEFNKKSLVFDHFRLSAINLGCSGIVF